MSIQTLKDIIEKQKKEQEEEQEFNKDEQIEEYKNLVDDLYKIALDPIQELINEGLIQESREEILINEELLGEYKIDALVLTINNKKIKFEPVGTMLIGSKGRVDVTGPFGKERFLLIRKGVKSPSDLVKVTFHVSGAPKQEEEKKREENKKPSISDWEWKTMPSDSRWVKFNDVNADTMTDIIMRMING